MPKKILTEISVGELIDKISILEIKIKNIKDLNKLTHINKEYKILLKIKKKFKIKKNIYTYYNQLKKVNTNFICIHNFIRMHAICVCNGTGNNCCDNWKYSTSRS